MNSWPTDSRLTSLYKSSVGHLRPAYNNRVSLDIIAATANERTTWTYAVNWRSTLHKRTSAYAVSRHPVATRRCHTTYVGSVCHRSQLSCTQNVMYDEPCQRNSHLSLTGIHRRLYARLNVQRSSVNFSTQASYKLNDRSTSYKRTYIIWA